jgi:hypothetical protein
MNPKNNSEVAISAMTIIREEINRCVVQAHREQRVNRGGHIPDGRSMPMTMAILCLGKEGPLPLSEVSQLLSITPAAITGVIDGLEYLDLVKRARWAEMTTEMRGSIARAQRKKELEGSARNRTNVRSRLKIYAALTQKGQSLVDRVNGNDAEPPQETPCQAEDTRI